jgi:hypothetical protein
MKNLIVPALGALAVALLIAAPAAQANSKYADVRVLTNDGLVLAEHRQYTDDVRIRTSTDADCFGPSNPSSGDSYRRKDPSVLGALIDSSRVDGDLKPLLITDGFVDEGFGFGVCDIGGIETVGFSYWYAAVNGVGATTGPDLIPVSNGDRNTWYLTTGNEPGFPSELLLRAPDLVEPNQPFEVKVTRVRADGSREPAEGVSVLGGTGGTTGPDGTVVLSVPEGVTNLGTEGESVDIPSASEFVCAAGPNQACPERGYGERIYGSRGPDEIRATRGEDFIVCGRGDDIVRAVEQGDFVGNDCEKVRR